MSILDVFKSDAFSVVEMTDAINVVPNKYGRLNELNVFPDRPLMTRTAVIEQMQHELNLLPTKPVGAPATKGTVGKRDLRSVTIPHIPHEDVILAEEVNGVRAFGTDGQLKAIMQLVSEKQATMVDKFAITLEYLRWGALSGLIYDADGSTELLDIFSLFGISETEIDFELDDEATVVDAKIRTLKRHFEQNSFGQSYNGIHVMCAPDFFESLIGHTSVRDDILLANRGTMTTNMDYRNKLVLSGVVFEEHAGTATDAAGNVHKFIPDGYARAFPVGAPGMMKTFYAPAPFIETVNTMARPLYSKQRILPYDVGVEVHMQSNPLPFCNRPQLLVKLKRY